MISKTKIKELAQFKNQKKCEENGVFVVEGIKMAEEALASGWQTLVVCATEEWHSQHPAIPQHIEQYEVSESELERLSGMKHPSEVWMLLRRPLSNDCPSQTAITLVLDHLQDPGNMGTIIRTADWFGIRHIVCSPDTVDCFNPKVVQSTMGSLFRTDIQYTDICKWLEQCHIPVYGAALGGEDLFRIQASGTGFDLPAALVIGNESRGISPEVKKRLTKAITIPNIGRTAESLNASVATAIAVSTMVQSTLQQTEEDNL